jgi:gliding motility-associated-like protein
MACGFKIFRNIAPQNNKPIKQALFMRIKFYATVLSALFVMALNQPVQAQCEITATVYVDTLVCGQCVSLYAFGQGQGQSVFNETFNSGAPSGWAFTSQAQFNNPCSPGGVDGTSHIWMGNNTGVPRILRTLPLNFSTATAGATICFDMLFAEQTGDAASAPCEGPDEPDEGVSLQYSIDGGTTWVNINYFDPNGGSDPQLINWNNWCFQIPAAALTSNTIIRWFQDNDSGADYDHWGIDNVSIYFNDPTFNITWQHDGFAYGLGNAGGANPTAVCPQNTTTYNVTMSNGTTTCSTSVTIPVRNPQIAVTATQDNSLCPGECDTLSGQSRVIVHPAQTPTYFNGEFEAIATGFGQETAININVQGLNMGNIYPGAITQVCITNLFFFGTGFSGFPPQPTQQDIGSLNLYLQGPNGTRILLVPAGTTTGANNPLSGGYNNTCFVPAGPPISGSAPYTGSWSPNQPFNNFVGQPANGVWSIVVESNSLFSFGAGTFFGWSITFDDPEISYPALFSWTPQNGMTNANTLNPIVCPSTTTNYQLVVQDSAGCVSDTASVLISIDAACCPLWLNATVDGPDCQLSNGSITLNPGGGSGTYTFSWSTGATTASLSNLGAGTYTVTVVDVIDGCTRDTSVVFTAATPPNLSIQAQAPENCGLANGSVTLNVAGGTAPYGYSWTGGQNANPATNLSAGPISVTVTDAAGCTASLTAIVSGTPGLTLGTPTEICAPDGNTYTVSFSISGGDGSYTVNGNAITGSVFTSAAVPVGVGYTFTVSDGVCPSQVVSGVGACLPANFCNPVGNCPGPNLVADGSFSLFNSANPTQFFTSNYDYSPCPGLVCTNVSTGQPILCQYDYSVQSVPNTCNADWITIGDHTTGAGNMMIVDFPAGNVGASNNIWCQTINLAPNTEYCFGAWFVNLLPTGSNQPQPIFGFAVNGNQIGVTPSLPENQSWNYYGFQFNSGVGGNVSICISNVNFGNVGFDLAIDDIVLRQLNAVSPPNTQTDIVTVCEGNTNINIEVLANDSPGLNPINLNSLAIDSAPSNGTAVVNGSAIDYTPNPGFNGTDQFTYTLCDINACCNTGTVLITINGIDLSPDTTICLGSQTQINVTGANVLQSTWLPLTGIVSQTNTSAVVAPTLTTTYYVQSSLQGQNVVVNGNFDAGDTGFNSNYIYGTGGTYGLLSNEGTYAIATSPSNVHVNFASCIDHTGNNGNMMVVNGSSVPGSNIWCQTISVSPNTDYSFSTWATSAEGTNPAVLQFSINGVTLGSPFGLSGFLCQWEQFFETWNSGANTVVTICINNQNTATSGNDFAIDDITFTPLCQVVDSVTVTVQTASASITGTTSYCVGDTLELTGVGGTAFNWTGPAGFTAGGGPQATINNVQPVNAGTYFVTVTDQQGCTDTASVQVSINGIGLNLSTQTNVTCNALCNATATVAASSGTPPYTYSFFDNAGTLITSNSTGQATGLCAGSYSVSVSDGSSSICSTPINFTVTEPTALNTQLSASNTSCGTDNGSINVSAAGGTATYTYTWSANAGVSNNSTTSLSNLTPGTYSVTIADANGCADTLSSTILPSDSVLATGTSTNVSCFGLQDGNIILNVTPTASYNYNWSNGATTADVNSLAPGQYAVTVTNSSTNCADTLSFTIVEGILVTADAGLDTVIFAGDSLLLTGLSNDPTASFSWAAPSFTAGGPNAWVAPVSTTRYTLFAAVGPCVATDEVVVNVQITEVSMPNAFTPNGDGTNDTFGPTSPESVQIVNMRVHNRWGQLMFDGAGEWDGKFNGELQARDVYIYRVTIRYPNGQEQEFVGDVTLIL